MEQTKTKSYNNPWKDIASYNLLDANGFKGREEDVLRFSRLIDNGTITVLYSDSGIGKTSFLNAGISSKYLKKGYFPIRISFIDEVLSDSFIDNIEEWIIQRLVKYFEIIESDALKKTSIEELKGLEWMYLHEYQIDNFPNYLWWFLHTNTIVDKKTGTKYQPFIIFDQFEEVFSKTESRASRKILHDLFKAIEDVSSSAVPTAIDVELEKLEKRNIYLDIDCNPNYKIVFSLRKEYLAEFDYWTNKQYSIPELYRNRMLLLPLTREQAERVITQQPDPEKDGDCIDTLNEVKDIIIDRIDVKGTNEVEPLMLSVLCSRLYDEAMSKGINHLTKQDVAAINIDTLVATFYNDIVSGVIKDAKLLSEFEEQMVDKDNHRNKVKSSSLLNGLFDDKFERKDSEGKAIETSYKEELEDKHIIRVEKYNGEDYVELIHDRLCDVIKERRIHRKNRELNLQRRKNRMNVLTPQGRRLIDNELEFDYDPAKYKSDLRWVLDDYVIHGRMMEKLASDKKMRADGSYTSTDFRELLDTSTSDNTSVRLGFIDKDNNPVVTSDGIDSIDLSFNERNQITQIVFRETIQHANGSKSYEPFYLGGGYCGIRIDYDGERERSRTYLQFEGNDYIPVNTAEGYATIEFSEFDKYDFPHRTMFKDVNGDSIMHNSGNHGFKSDYDEDGYEILRLFVNENLEPQKLLSGIYARQLDYDKSDGSLKAVINLNNKLSPTYDKNGYCKVRFVRDDWGRIIRESYYDEFDTLCLCKNGYATEVTKYFDIPDGRHSISWYTDIMELPVQHKDGHWKARFDYDENNYIVAQSFGHSVNNSDPDNSDFIQRSKTVLLYDRSRHIVGIRNYKGKDDYSDGFWFEYNKEYNHVIRMGGLGEKGERSNLSSWGDNVFIIELRESKKDQTNPLLRVFLDEKGCPVICNEGYKASRRWYEKKSWLDDDSRMVKEMYYDEHGFALPDNFGVYGNRYEYDNDNLVVRQYGLDKKERDCNDSNGICCSEIHYYDYKRIKSKCWYDCSGNRCPNADGLFGEEHHWSDDNLTHTIIYIDKNGHPCDKELGYAYYIEEKDKNFPDQDKRLYYLDKRKRNVVVDGICVGEFLYNECGKWIGFQNVDANGRLLMTNKGYAVFKTEISEDGTISRKMYFDDNNNPVSPKTEGYFMEEIHYDGKGRTIKFLRYDENCKRQEFGGGVYSFCFEYGDQHDSRTVFSLDEYDHIITSPLGFAREMKEYDDRGRELQEIYFDVAGAPVKTSDGDYGKRWEYIDSSGSFSIIEMSINQQGKLMINNSGFSIKETVFDEDRNPIKISFYDAEHRPIVNPDGYHSEIIKYKYDDESNTKISTTSFTDIYGQSFLFENKASKIIRHLDFSNRIIQEYWLDENDNMVPYDNLANLYIKKREYINSIDDGYVDEYIESYYDADESLREDNRGVAYEHIWLKDKDEIGQRMRYNANNEAVKDEFGNCGERIEYEKIDNVYVQKWTGLDENGCLHTNTEGFTSQVIALNERKQIISRAFFDEANHKTTNKLGEYGIRYDFKPNNTIITTSLDSEYEPFSPIGRAYAIQEKTVDEQGRTTHIFWRDAYNNPYVDEYGDSGFNIIYGDGYEIREFLNKNGCPHINKKGRAKTMTYTGSDCFIEMWLDVDDNPIPNSEGDCGMMVRSNKEENSETYSFLDEEIKPHKNSEGWTFKKIYSFDNSDNTEIHYFDAGMQHVEDQDGDMAYRKEMDEDGSILYISLDENGNPRNNKNGYAYRKVVLDDQGRILNELWYDVDSKPFCNDKGDYGRLIRYDAPGNSKITVSLDANGEPHINKEGYTMRLQELDEFGRIIQEMWLDEQEVPIKDKDTGCCGIRMYYLDDSHMEILINLDHQMRPCNDNQGRSIVKIWKDDSNRIVKVLSFDVLGNPICNDKGDYGIRYIYTDDSNMVILESLGPDGSPQVNRYGYRKEIRFSKESYSVYLDDQDTPITISGQESQYRFPEMIENLATREMILFQSVQEGQLQIEGFNGRYALLKYNKWQIGLPFEVLGVEIEKSKEKEKQLVFVECMEGAHVKFGNHFYKLFKEGLLGARFSSEGVSCEVFMELVKAYDNNVQRMCGDGQL